MDAELEVPESTGEESGTEMNGREGAYPEEQPRSSRLSAVVVAGTAEGRWRVSGLVALGVPSRPVTAVQTLVSISSLGCCLHAS